MGVVSRAGLERDMVWALARGNAGVCVPARSSFAPNPPKRGPLALSGEPALGRALRKGGPHG